MLALVGILRFLEHALLYHPHPYRANYRQLLPAGAVELRFETKAGRQTAFFVPPNDRAALPNRIWVAFCGNGSLALDWLPLVREDHRPGDAFLLIDYPGYGESEGWPNVANTRAAAEGALLALAARLGVAPATFEPRLDTLGHSLGAAAALDFAGQHPQVGRVILFAPFTSLREEAAFFLGGALARLLPDDYNNRAVLRSLAQRLPPPRVVIFHGMEDGLILPRMGRELAAAFPGLVSFRAIPGANHDTIVGAAEEAVLEIMAADPPARAAQ